MILKEDLKGHSDDLQLLKDTIQEAVEDLLDTERIFSRQSKVAIAELQGRIRQHFPDLFEDPSLDEDLRQERMDAAIAYARRYFQQERSMYRRKTEIGDMGKREIQECSTTITRRTIQSNTPPKTAASVIREYAQAYSLLEGSRCLEEPFSHKTILKMLGGVPSRHVPPSAASSSSPPSEPDTVPSDNNSAPHSTPSPPPASTPSPTPGLECRADEVAEFLRSCIPDMQHLSDSFIQYGCRNREFLKGVAGLSETDIDEFLEKVIAHAPPSHTSDPMLEMDMFLLKKHFKKYFACVDQGD
ncbi:hypothetical protein P691DRAFT_831583 [Macrolepiota fuliginosa MF-IS2]|uniref:Uncharacterized protein n=1 Tax=Macrolepiota fuliginosa MF-IS2 TaxID=1400762 RepID=A0A9P5X6P8_9AGAR|nr:hypothetical protein P691DRAFT_831583 [Macrolepiota fuliginosa MF-IS2]